MNLLDHARLALLLLALAAVLVGLAAGAAHAQNAESRLNLIDGEIRRLRELGIVRDGQVAGLERRLASLEQTVHGLNLEARLVRLETLSEATRTIVLGVAVAVLAQLAVQVVPLLRRRNGGTP